MPSESQIPAPRVPITEKEGGIITREWFRFFNYVYETLLRLTSFAYGSFSGATTTAWAANVVSQVPITSTTLSNSLSLAASRITVANAGIYSVNASFQLYNPDLTIPYSIYLWARVSGVDIYSSVRHITVPAGNASGGVSFTSHSIALTLQLPAAAYIELYGVSPNGIAQLYAFTSGETSVLLNITQIA
jgi:hypothetical protein